MPCVWASLCCPCLMIVWNSLSVVKLSTPCLVCESLFVSLAVPCLMCEPLSLSPTCIVCEPLSLAMPLSYMYCVWASLSSYASSLHVLRVSLSLWLGLSTTCIVCEPLSLARSLHYMSCVWASLCGYASPLLVLHVSLSLWLYLSSVSTTCLICEPLSLQVHEGFDPAEMGDTIRQLALSVQDTGMFGDLPRPRMMGPRGRWPLNLLIGVCRLESRESWLSSSCW